MNELLVTVINNFYIITFMIEYNNKPNSSSKEAKYLQWDLKETVGTIQSVSKNIQEYSLMMREAVKTLRESGAIPEIILAIRESSFAVRDTLQEINQTTQDMKKTGHIVDTADAIETTLKTAEDSVINMKEIASGAEHVSPKTTRATRDGIFKTKYETSKMTDKMIAGIKNMVRI